MHTHITFLTFKTCNALINLGSGIARCFAPNKLSRSMFIFAAYILTRFKDDKYYGQFKIDAVYVPFGLLSKSHKVEYTLVSSKSTKSWTIFKCVNIENILHFQFLKVRWLGLDIYAIFSTCVVPKKSYIHFNRKFFLKIVKIYYIRHNNAHVVKRKLCVMYWFINSFGTNIQSYNFLRLHITKPYEWIILSHKKSCLQWSLW